MKIDVHKGKTGKSTVKALDASTVILIRESGEEPFEIFLMCRHSKQKFMGGAYVFPGGKVDDDDCCSELKAFTKGVSSDDAKRFLNEPDISDDRALGIFVASIRETFEEAGVLLATSSEGNIMELSDGDISERFASYRVELHKGSLSMKEMAEKEKMVYALDRLVPYSHWITPQHEPKRFDTRFFLARLPEGQVPVHDNTEMTNSKWLSPKSALKQHKEGKIVLPPPTLKTIEELSAFKSADNAFKAAKLRKIYTILPQAFATADGFGVKLPHDPEYSLEAYKQPHDPDNPSRVVFQAGRWRTLQIPVA